MESVNEPHTDQADDHNCNNTLYQGSIEEYELATEGKDTEQGEDEDVGYQYDEDIGDQYNEDAMQIVVASVVRLI